MLNSLLAYSKNSKMNEAKIIENYIIVWIKIKTTRKKYVGRLHHGLHYYFNYFLPSVTLHILLLYLFMMVNISVCAIGSSWGNNKKLLPSLFMAGKFKYFTRNKFQFSLIISSILDINQILLVRKDFLQFLLKWKLDQN